MIIQIIIILFLVVLTLLYLETKKFKVTKYIINTEKLNESQFKIVFLSDLHAYEYGKDNISLLEAIDEQRPDLIICAGDMLVSKAPEKTAITLDFMKKISSKYKVFYANGNHEYRMKINTQEYGSQYEDYKNELISYGVMLLENKFVSIEICGTKINIYGLEIDKKYYQRFSKIRMDKSYINNKIGVSLKEGINLLIAHNPDYAECYSDWGADVTFSGHLHGGVMRFPVIGAVISPQFHLFPRYSGDMYNVNGKEIIVSKGLGAHSVPIRIFDRAELITVEIKNLENSR